MEKRESKIRDLEEKLQRGKLTPKEALKTLKERGLTEKETWEFIPWVIYFILWLLPAVSRTLKLDFLEFFAQLPAIRLPAILIYISLVIVAIGTFFLVWSIRSHRTRGGLKKAGETVIFYKEGPYRIVRHPGALGGLIWPILLPVILSTYVPFTILSIAAIIIMVVYLYYGCHLEEKKLDIPKWGDEYQQYMEEVPRFNFIQGLWRLARRQ